MSTFNLEAFPFCVVEFVDDKDKLTYVEAVPRSWVNEESRMCRWPNIAGPQLDKLRKVQSSPENQWITYNNIKILKLCSDFKTARSKAILAETKNSLDTSEDLNKGKKKTRGAKNQLKSTRDLSSERDNSSSSSSSSILAINFCSSLEPPTSIFVDPPSNNNDQIIIPSTSLAPHVVASSTVELNEPNFQPNVADNSEIICSDNFVVVDDGLLAQLTQTIQDFKEVILREIQEVKSDIAIIRAQVLQQNKTAVVPARCSKIPMKTVEDWSELEVWLGSVEEAKQIIVTDLELIGGNDLNDLTRRLLARIMTAELSKQVNFTGSNGKLNFGASPFYNILIESIRCYSDYSNTHERKIRECVMRWFNNSSDRGGGRERRRKNNQAETVQ
ncbi:hypothetical protein Fcan01_23291 [Folsomia candida]|uniref:DUF4806 domain-containing protein n=1 Tax=Folsomia candida TaxID=158441 RepID=A0A226D967_FOLCA|nr:hypothetical protein Fcan01_23291 [Folsomia candida]